MINSISGEYIGKDDVALKVYDKDSPKPFEMPDQAKKALYGKDWKLSLEGRLRRLGVPI